MSRMRRRLKWLPESAKHKAVCKELAVLEMVATDAIRALDCFHTWQWKNPYKSKSPFQVKNTLPLSLGPNIYCSCDHHHYSGDVTCKTVQIALMDLRRYLQL